MKLKINYSSLNFFLFPFSFLLLIIITLLSCTTQPQSGSLSGTIQLQGEADHSGITLAIYQLSTLDPDIVEANQKWPHIGVIINQHTEFDHRFGTLVKTGETNASGYFEITDIPTGVYNMVAIKDGYGFRYLYEISISANDNSLSNIMKQSPLNDNYEETDRNFEMKNEKCKMNNEPSSPHSSLSIMHYTLDSKNKVAKADITLYPETIISSDITSPTVFESFHHYIIEDDIYVNDTLTIEPGAVIRLNEGVKMTIYGDLTAIGQEDNFIWFTSNDSLFSLFPSLSGRSGEKPDPFSPKPSLFEYKMIELTGSLNKEVSYCKFDHAGTGLFSRVNGFEISDCIFRDSQCGFKSMNVDSTFCSNLLCVGIYNEEQGGIYFVQVGNGLIEKNIVNDCENGMIIKDGSNPEIKNNYHNDCNIGFDISYYSSPDVHNNEIYECYVGIFIGFWSCANIINNKINGDYGIVRGKYPISQVIIVNFNNISSTIYAIELTSFVYLTANTELDAKNNYFFTTDDDEIQELIYDRNDVEGYLQEYTGIVLYEPFFTQEYPYAGIQGE